MARKPLPNAAQIARHLSSRDFDADGDGNLVIFPHAFELRDGEPYLSAAWFDFFRGPKADRAAATAAHLAAGRKVTSAHGLAVGTVSEIRDACEQFGQREVRIIHEPKPGNAIYVAVRRYKSEPVELLDLLARDAWAECVRLSTHTATVGPWPKQ